MSGPSCRRPCVSGTLPLLGSYGRKSRLRGSLRGLLRLHEVVCCHRAVGHFRNSREVPNREARTVFPAVHRHRINTNCGGKLLTANLVKLEILGKGHAYFIPVWYN